MNSSFVDFPGTASIFEIFHSVSWILFWNSVTNAFSYISALPRTVLFTETLNNSGSKDWRLGQETVYRSRKPPFSRPLTLDLGHCVSSNGSGHREPSLMYTASLWGLFRKEGSDGQNFAPIQASNPSPHVSHMMGLETGDAPWNVHTVGRDVLVWKPNPDLDGALPEASYGWKEVPLLRGGRVRR